MNATTDGMLDEMVRRIVERFAPEKVYLFGSRARGDARPDSDYDLLVVLDEFPDRRRAAVEIRRVLADLQASKDVIVATPAEAGSELRRCSIIVRAALKEGRLLYERP